MSTEQHINRFDELIRQKLDSYEAEPDMDLLANIHARKNRFLNSRNLLTLMILLVILTAGIIGGYFYSGTRLKQSEQSSNDSAIGYNKNAADGHLTGFGTGYSATTANVSRNGQSTQQAIFTNPSVVAAQNATQTNAGSLRPASNNNNTTTKLNLSDRTYTLLQQAVTGQIAPGQQQAAATKENSPTANAKDGKNGKPDAENKNTADENQKQDETTSCSVSFDYYTSYDEAFHFIASTSTPSTYITFKWTFGDGESSAEANPKHVYSKPGQYAATLTAFNTKTNCKAEVYKLIRVTKGVELTSSSIKGTVFADAEYAGKTIVQLIEHNSQHNTFEVIQTTLTNNKGQYEFSDITGGNYIVRSSSYKNYLPTFYGNSTEKDYATDILVFNNDYKILSGYDIQLVSNRPLAGNTLVKADEPGSRVMVIVDENNQPLVTVIVSRDGVITSPVNLPSGDYKLIDPQTGKVAGGVSVDHGGIVSTKPGTSAGEVSGPETEKNLSLAPNPASEYVKIGLSNASSSPVEITIINSIGAIVQQNTLPGGTSINTLNINHLPGGTYYIIANQDGVSTSSTLVKAVDSSK